jgi:hypothetical protein
MMFMPRRKTKKEREQLTSEKELSDGARKLLELIPEEGSITNNALKHKLRRAGGFPTKKYWDYRKELIDHNLIQFGLGRGGSVLLKEPTKEIGEVEKEKREEEKEREPKFHVFLKDYLEDNDVRDIRQRPHSKAWVAVTGNPKGWKRQSGHYSRPDVIMVSLIRYEYLPERDVTITTYEMKKRQALTDTDCVFEAASHQKGAHNAYVICETTRPQTDEDREISPELSQTLDRFGVGFAWFYLTKEKEYELDIIVEPKLQTPRPADENKLLEDFRNQLPEPQKEEFDEQFPRYR